MGTSPEPVPLGLLPNQTPAEAVEFFCAQHRCAPDEIPRLVEIVTNDLDAFSRRYFVNVLLHSIFTSRQVWDLSGSSRPLNSNVDPVQGRVLYDLVLSHTHVHRTLEVGMAYGVSSLYLAQAHFDRTDSAARAHVSVDPFQRTQWGSIGIS